jgi:hypothetical protein
MSIKSYILNFIFINYFLILSTKAQDRIFVFKPGFNTIYSFNGGSTYGVGLSALISKSKNNSSNSNYYQISPLYKIIIKNGNKIEHDISLFFDYSFVSNKILGFSTAFDFSISNTNNFLTPYLGLNYFGFFSIYYGYNLSSNHYHQIKARNLITLRLTLSKIYFYSFRNL